MVATQAPVETEIFYPETDGMPMPDGRIQAPVYRKAVRKLEAHFKDDERTDVNGDTFIYYSEGNLNLRVAPDCYVAFDLSDAAFESLDRNNTYLLWEVGLFPQFIMEIGSPSTGSYDQGGKRLLYARLGSLEYWLYDPSGGEYYDEPLVGLRLVDGEYVRLEMNRESDGSVWGHSDLLNLDLWWIDGEIEFWDPEAKRWLPNLEEAEAARAEAEALAVEEQAERLIAEARADAAVERADAADNRATATDKRADSETARADAAEALAARLEAELRRLRGEDEE